MIKEETTYTNTLLFFWGNAYMGNFNIKDGY